MSGGVQKLISQRVVLLTGDESALRRETLDSMLDALGMAKDDFDLEHFDGDSSSPSAWIGSVVTSPFLADRRVAIVRHVLRCDLEKKGIDLKVIPESGLLILVADEEGGEERSSRAKTNERAWRKAVEKAGGGVFDAKVDTKRTGEEVRKRVVAGGKTISPRALETLVEMCGGSLSRCLDELEKLVIYVGDSAQIREDDVRGIVVASREWNVFRMVDSIVGGEVGEALRQLRVLLGTNKGESAAHGQVVPMVLRSLRLIWQARVCLDAGTTPHDAPLAIRATFPEKPSILSEPPYRLASLMQNARRLDLYRIEKGLQVLSDTDARLKGALDAFNSLETLERMVLELAALFAPVKTGRR